MWPHAGFVALAGVLGLVVRPELAAARRACDAEAMLADALLDFLPQQGADTLILEPGKPPVLCASARSRRQEHAPTMNLG